MGFDYIRFRKSCFIRLEACSFLASIASCSLKRNCIPPYLTQEGVCVLQVRISLKGLYVATLQSLGCCWKAVTQRPLHIDASAYVGYIYVVERMY